MKKNVQQNQVLRTYKGNVWHLDENTAALWVSFNSGKSDVYWINVCGLGIKSQNVRVTLEVKSHVKEFEVAWLGPWSIFTTTMQWWNWQKWTPADMSHFDVTHATHLF